MKCSFRSFATSVSAAFFAACFSIPSTASANINLELRPIAVNVSLNCPIKLGLYAVSDSGVNQLTAAVQVILNWDISRVQLLGSNNAGAPPYLSSGFAANPYHLNDSTTDGDAMWIAMAPLGSGNAIQCTPAGTLLTTFTFQTVAGTNPTTAIIIARSGGTPVGQTIVYDGTIPNTNVTGSLSGSAIDINACVADITGNGFVNVDDLLAVINGWGPCVNPLICCPGDITGNGFVNVDDLLAVINGWGACP